MTQARYARQIAVPGVGTSGQRVIASADVVVDGSGLAAEVCALYLAGAGIGTLAVSPLFAGRCRELTSDIRIVAAGDEHPKDHVQVALALESGGARARFEPEPSGDAVFDGSIAARWVLARLLSERPGGE